MTSAKVKYRSLVAASIVIAPVRTHEGAPAMNIIMSARMPLQSIPVTFMEENAVPASDLSS